MTKSDAVELHGFVEVMFRYGAKRGKRIRFNFTSDRRRRRKTFKSTDGEAALQWLKALWCAAGSRCSLRFID